MSGEYPSSMVQWSKSRNGGASRFLVAAQLDNVARKTKGEAGDGRKRMDESHDESSLV